MELNLEYESICINEIVFNGIMEQSVELDYLLPDYCHGIFKVLKCKITPKIMSYQLSANKLVVDGMAYIKVIYVSEENNCIRSFEQKMPFTKSVDVMGEVEHPNIMLNSKCDYVNCRVVNSKRLDIRGAISINACVTDQKSIDVLTDANGSGVHLKKQSVNIPNKKLYGQRQFVVKEDVDISVVNCIENIIYSETKSITTECKIIANKVICKGEVIVHTLYSSETDAEPEVMEHIIPVSQIVDVTGIDEQYNCIINFDVKGLIINSMDAQGENNLVEMELSMGVYCEGYFEKQVELVDDAYSTIYETEMILNNTKIEKVICEVNQQEMMRFEVDIPTDNLSCIYDVVCDVNGVSHSNDDKIMTINCDINNCVIGKDCDNIPVMFEQSKNCEVKFELPCCYDNVMFNPNVKILSVSYTMISKTKIEVRIEVKVKGCLYTIEEYNVVTDIQIDSENKKCKDKSSALTLYFADKGEDIWNIAKRYNTSAQAILNENNLENQYLKQNGMILIPIVD